MKQSCSRREVLKVSLVGFSLASLFRGTAEAQQKVPKQMVQYQDSPKGGHQCSTCSNFVAPGSCKVVEGKISAHGWCSIWTPK
jgi:hypothetical protein